MTDIETPEIVETPDNPENGGTDEWGKYVEISGYKYYVYASIEEANRYCAAITGTPWNLLDDTAKAQRLVEATRKIDSYNYVGKKVDENQPLKFPRVNSRGVKSDDQVLTDLCCEIANYFATYGTSSSGGGISEELLNNVEKYQIGDFNVTFKKDAEIKIDVDSFDDIIQKALKEWMYSQTMEIWL